ncbi:MAG TPA: CYTH domain-containing protein [Candidatus Anaerotignum merdipullorum]|nr:CYTH domain-containing protein [Candidatus Anaerotignum merdipullorum]
MEIERKFLTTAVPFALTAFPSEVMVQAYISTSPTIRLRQSNDVYFLTVKGKGLLAKEEFELEITKEEYTHLLEKVETPAVEKIRYRVPLEGGWTAEVDVYQGKLQGLVTTEVEFPTMEAARAFVPPDWFGRDVTMDGRYKNTSLALYGIPKEAAKP